MAGFEHGLNTSNTTFGSQNRPNMPGEFPEYERHIRPNNDNFGPVIQGPFPNPLSDSYARQQKEKSPARPPPLVMNHQPSVIQGDLEI